MKTQAVVETVYVGQTNHKPSRVRAKHVTTGKRVFVSWDYNLGADENHKRAAAKLLGCEPEWSASVNGGGYLFGASRYQGVVLP